MGKDIDLETASTRDIAESMAGDEDLLRRVVEGTAGGDRRMRQRCAEALSLLSESDPTSLIPYSTELADALSRPEARTRWQMLDVFRRLIPVDSRSTDKAVGGAETTLYDEGSGPARLAAFRFLAAYGATTETRAERVWPLVDEAIQCYHGDPEFDDMLTATLAFANGKIGRGVSKQLATRMEFDAENSRGPVGRLAKEIIAACK